MAKIKETRSFLNPIRLDCPGVIKVSPYYDKDTLSSITLTLADCSRTINLEFDFDDKYVSLKARKFNLKNSIGKAKLLKDKIDMIYEALLAVELKPNDQDARIKKIKK